MYEYRATLIRVVDADTVRVNLDLGCDVVIRLTLRLARINAPEMGTPEGIAARDWLVMAIKDRVLTVNTYKDRREKYGRYLADLHVGDGCLNDMIVEAGHATYV